MPTPAEIHSEVALRCATIRRIYDHDCAQLGAVLAMDIARYETWAHRIARAEGAMYREQMTTLGNDANETGRLLGNAMNAIARLVEHIDHGV